MLAYNANISLFPLNVVLFPGMMLPLHIFEERYRTMIKECLAGDQIFGVVLAKSKQAQALTQLYLGQIWRSLGDYMQALKYQQDALDIKRAIGDKSGEADSLGNIGVIYIYLGVVVVRDKLPRRICENSSCRYRFSWSLDVPPVYYKSLSINRLTERFYAKSVICG